jgi:Chitobiase/beta-hexosaminidase C-terminal domain
LCIRYPVDGSTPTSPSGISYAGAVSISSNTTLKAIAFKTGLNSSAVTSGVYNINTVIGETGTAPGFTYTIDSGNGNLIVAQPVTLIAAKTIQSLTFYVENAAGSLTLDVYNDASGAPNLRKTTTALFTPTAGSNTQNVLAPISLPAGNYWLVYLPSSNGLSFRKTTGGTSKYHAFTYAALPGTFPASPSDAVNVHCVFSATLN